VLSAHKVFLLLRDCAALCCLFLVVFGPWALIAMSNRLAAAAYAAMLVAQYVIVRHGAADAGVRLVTKRWHCRTR
jgi:hypothetical protein